MNTRTSETEPTPFVDALKPGLFYRLIVDERANVISQFPGNVRILEFFEVEHPFVVFVMHRGFRSKRETHPYKVAIQNWERYGRLELFQVFPSIAEAVRAHD